MLSLLKYLLRKRIIFNYPKKVKVVIFGSFVKKFSFGNNISYLIINDEIYFKIFLKALVNFLFKKKRFNSLNDFYFYELIKYTSPSVAIGNEINKNIFKFKKFFPQKISIGYQLVYWSNIHKFLIKEYFGNKKDYACDYFLIFSKKSLKYLNFIKTNFIISGSIKNNFNYLSKKKTQVKFRHNKE